MVRNGLATVQSLVVMPPKPIFRVRHQLLVPGPVQSGKAKVGGLTMQAPTEVGASTKKPDAAKCKAAKIQAIVDCAQKTQRLDQLIPALNLDDGE